MQYRRLSPGSSNSPQISILGFGASVLGNVFGDVPLEEGDRAVRCAVDHGINFFDTSPYYGITLSEQRLGAAMSGIREKIFLATKCGRYGAAEFDFSADRITRGFEDSLRRLRTDFVDLLQVHDCEFTTIRQVVEETLPALEAIRASGKARFIGITGYQLGNLQTIATQALARGIHLDSILSYCHYDLANTSLLQTLAPFANANHLGLINASPLHMGLLTEATPPAWHPASKAAQQACARAARFCVDHGKRIEQVALRFCLDNADVASTLIGMGTPATVEANLKVLDQENDPAFVAELQEMLRDGGAEATWPSGLPENWDPD